MLTGTRSNDRVRCHGACQVRLLAPAYRESGGSNQGLHSDFLLHDGSFGSGTFVNIGGFAGILTAFHVAEHLGRFGDFVLIVADYAHRLEATARTVEHVPIGIPSASDAPESGPDLSFLVIRNPTFVEAIQSEKLFYNMDFAQLDPLLAPTKPKIWGVAGTYTDSFRRIAEDYLGEPLSKLQNFVGTGVFVYETWQDDFDYIRLTVPAGESKFPWHYEGLSGGGFWLIPMEVDANGDVNTLSHRPPLLAGVQFAQSDRQNSVRVLTGHGFNSIGPRLRDTLKAGTTSIYPLPKADLYLPWKGFDNKGALDGPNSSEGVAVRLM